MEHVYKALQNSEITAEVSELLYGDGAWEITKALTAQERRERTQARVGLASNIVGIAAGGAGLIAASRRPALRHATAVAEEAGPLSGRLVGTKGRLAALGRKAKLTDADGKITNRGRRVIQTGAGGAVALQAANLVGDGVSNRVLSRSANPDKKKKPVAKKHDWAIKGEISKMDTEKRQVFGWASVIEKDGEPVVDLQGDYLTLEVIEKAAYEYVRESRKGGDMHQKGVDGPVHKSDLIESFIVTPEKKEQMGLPASSPTGWWVGFQVNDDELWQAVKDGKRPEFSIHGMGSRVEKFLEG